VVEQALAESEQAVCQQFLRPQTMGKHLLYRAVTADAQELGFLLEPVELIDVAVSSFGHKLDEVYVRTLYSREIVAASAAMRRQSMHKEHILQEAANSLFTAQGDREELCWQVREALDRDRQLPAEVASKLPSLCDICEACCQICC
jgi:hypothetical protein